MDVATNAEVDSLIASDSPVAVGVSGGKDSAAAAIATFEHLDQVGHSGPRLLIHADLGVTEWADSLPSCQRLSELTGVELQVVRRPQGDMMDRWEQRWRDNVRRWESMHCVKIILPWSTPEMRFCTSELKVDQICRALSRRFEGRKILNVTGIRAEESTDRRSAPISKQQHKLSSVTRRTSGLDWHPILYWKIDQVFSFLESRNSRLHEAYTTYGSPRVSCVYCMLATESCHLAGARDQRNHALAHRMADLEIKSTFAFQGDRWLADTLADVVGRRGEVARSKERAAARVAAESEIPKHLLYTKGWPTCVPTESESQLLASVRARVADAVGLARTYTDPTELRAAYRELMEEKRRRCA